MEEYRRTVDQRFKSLEDKVDHSMADFHRQMLAMQQQMMETQQQTNQKMDRILEAQQQTTQLLASRIQSLKQQAPGATSANPAEFERKLTSDSGNFSRNLKCDLNLVFPKFEVSTTIAPEMFDESPKKGKLEVVIESELKDKTSEKNDKSVYEVVGEVHDIGREVVLDVVSPLVGTCEEIVDGYDLYGDRLLSQVIPKTGAVVNYLITKLDEVASTIGPWIKLGWLELHNIDATNVREMFVFIFDPGGTFDVSVLTICNAARSDSHMANLNEVIKSVEDQCLKSYKSLDLSFSLGKLMISNFKSKYLVSQLDLKLISDLVVVIVSATCVGIACACAVAFCLLVAWCSDQIGLSFEMSSFATGVIITTTDLAQHTLELVEPIRNFFAAFFLVSIGMLIHVQFLWSHVDILLVSVLLVVGVIYQQTLFVANLGDSCVVLGKKVGNIGVVAAIQLSQAHDANVDETRQELHELHPDDSHIVVVKREVWRVKGIIQVSNSIGDVYMKHAQFNREPFGEKFRLSEPTSMPIMSTTPTILSHHLELDDSFLIFASDGLWEHLCNNEAVEIVIAQSDRANAIAVADVLLLQDTISAVPFCIAKTHQTASLVKPNVALALFHIGLASLTSVMGYFTPSVFLGPKCALWDCPKPAQGIG